MRARRTWVGLAVVVAVLASGTAWGLQASADPVVARAQGRALVRVHGGLVVHQAFDRPRPMRDLLDSYELNGSASPGIGYVHLGRQGLDVGVRAHPARWEGWFAVTDAGLPSSGVYHVVVSRPPGTVTGPGDQGEAVFAVQTGTTKRNGLINYVVVNSESLAGRNWWSLGYAHGHLADASTRILARVPSDPASPSTEEVTLRTDGRHSFSVWFGSRLVYSSDHLSLQIPPPYQAYLEVQAHRIAYDAYFHDFWVTANDTLEVAGLPPSSHLVLERPSGQPIASAQAGRSSATLELPPPEARGTAVLVVDGHLRLGPFAYAGGDRYTLRPA